MRVQIVDPPAYTPPYDRALAAALARAGARVELLTGPFVHGTVPPADGFDVIEAFHRRSARISPGSRARRPLRAAEHIADMLRWRVGGLGSEADVVHVQWAPVPSLDARLLPRRRPLVATAHETYPVDGWSAPDARAMRRLLLGMDAVTALSEHGARSLREGAGIPAERIRVIPHGPLDHLTRLPDDAPLPAELPDTDRRVVLFFGLIRPYKGPEVLLEAFRGIEGAELWIVGRPLGVDLGALQALASASQSTVRIVPRFVDDREVSALLRRADLVVLPYRQAEQSGVLYAALPFGKAIVMSDVGGFGELASRGAGRLVPPGDAAALHDTIAALLGDEEERRRLGEAALAAASGPYSWESIARAHLDLYTEVTGR